MLHAYTEHQLVEQPGIGLFAEPGWTTVSALQNLRRTRDPAIAGLPRLLSEQVSLSAAGEVVSLSLHQNKT